MKRKSRRAFLGLTAKMIGGTSLLKMVPFFNAEAYATNETQVTGSNPSRVLVIYGSYHGSTREIASFIGNRLRKNGIQSDVKSTNEDINFSHYDSIIMGAPIHRGKWMKAALDFASVHSDSLTQVPLSCFFTCMAAAVPSPNKEIIGELQTHTQSIIEIFPEIPPSHIGVFSGKLDYDKCSFIESLVIRTFMNKNNLPSGDHRNWQVVGDWVDDLKNHDMV